MLYSDPEGGQYVSYAKVNRHLSTLRSKRHPKSPRTLEEVIELFTKPAISAMYGHTGSDVPFYRGTVNTPSYGFSLFASESVVRLLAETERNFFADGTFRIVPKGCFRQLYIIHVEYKGHVSTFSFSEPLTNTN